jgi:hypothetical protein
MKIKKSSKINYKNIKSKIIPYGFSLFSIGFVGYILVSAINHYILKYLLF